VTEKTYSQKIARGFEIADYILLVPAVIGALLATLVAGLFTLVIYGIFFTGVILLVGYYKHARNTLNQKYSAALWIATAVYNSLLLLPCLYYASTLLQTGSFRDIDGRLDEGQIIFFLIVLSVVFGYFTAIILSLKAYSFEKRKSYISFPLSIKSPTI